MLRLFDFLLAFIGILLIWPIGLVLYIIGLFDTGSPLFLQKRVGRYQKPFTLIKYRTMRKDTLSVATHLASKEAVTGYGSFLRKSKLDELPQLVNVLTGSMSMVGARPSLLNQTELIEVRSRKGIYNHRPGITGLAQISSIDMSTPQLLAETDARMYETLNVRKYFYYIFATISGKGQGDRVK